MLKKHILKILTILSFFSCCIVVLYLLFIIKKDQSFEPYHELTDRNIPVEKHSGLLKIGIIGDSWAAGGKLDKPLQDALLSMGIKADIASSGHPGANSRQIYRNLLAEESAPYSSRKLLMDDKLDYMVVLAGVNDAATHMGSRFYAYHMLCIIRSLIQRDIRPVIVELPEFGIEVMPAGGVRSWTKRAIYRTIFDNMHDDVIDSYRKYLSSCLAGSLAASVVMLPFDPVAGDYSKSRELYADPLHLNDEGYRRLGRVIAEYICNDHNRKTKTD